MIITLKDLIGRTAEPTPVPSLIPSRVAPKSVSSDQQVSITSHGITFEEYLDIMKKYAPEGLKRISQNSGAKNLNEIVKINRTILRRIFLKFLSIQSELGSKIDKNDDGKIDIEFFLTFVQNGTIIGLQRDHKS
jgi:hypothetical protein